jgi:hypothetical protein
VALIKSVRRRFLSGERIRLIDYPKPIRHIIHAVILKLLDELPIRTRWEVLRERHVDGTRLSCQVYWIPADIRLSLEHS